MRVSRSELGATLCAMREWIDRHGRDPVKFDAGRDGDDILIKVEFHTYELAFAFRREWVLKVVEPTALLAA